MQSTMMKPKNDNIGLGLSASKQIARELKGDLSIKQSQKGLTVFKLKFPFKLIPNQYQKNQDNSNQSISLQQVSSNQNFSYQFDKCNQSSNISSHVDSSSESFEPAKSSSVMQFYGKKNNSFSKLLKTYLNSNFNSIMNIPIQFKMDEINNTDLNMNLI